MRPGDEVNGYVLTTAPITSGEGRCTWAFAKRGGREYFIRQFLQPTYPAPDGPGGAGTRAAKQRRCAAFAARHADVQRRLAPLAERGGPLVVTRDFFRHGSHYFSVAERVRVDPQRPADIARRPLEARLTLMINVLDSVTVLHDHHLVHGDIRPATLPVGPAGARLVDFDSCFVEGHPPPADDLISDAAWYAPELADYAAGVGGPDRLTSRADIFALGLTFTRFLTGAPGEPGSLARLLRSMTDTASASRPNSQDARDVLARIRTDMRGPGAPSADRNRSSPLGTLPFWRRIPRGSQRNDVL